MNPSIKYIVDLEHDDKGVAYSAVKALRATISRGGWRELTQVRLEDPTSRSSRLVLELTDGNIERIRTNLDNSGQFNETHKAKIVSIKREEPETDYTLEHERKIRSLENEVAQLRNNTSVLTAEVRKGRAHAETLEQQLKEVTKPISPRDSIIRYFCSLDLKVCPLLKDPLDILYANNVLQGNHENSLENYIKATLDDSLSDEEIKRLLDSTPNEHEKLSEDAAQKLKALKDESAYMEGIKIWAISVPPGIRAVLMSSKGELNYVSEILAIEHQIAELAKTSSKAAAVKRKSNSHQEICTALEFLQGQRPKMPVLIHSNLQKLTFIYASRTSNVDEGVSDRLVQEITWDLSKECYKVDIPMGDLLQISFEFLRDSAKTDAERVLDNLRKNDSPVLSISGYDGYEVYTIES